MTDLSPLEGVMAPLDEAKGLPNAHYTDPAVFDDGFDRATLGGRSGCTNQAGCSAVSVTLSTTPSRSTAPKMPRGRQSWPQVITPQAASR